MPDFSFLFAALARLHRHNHLVPNFRDGCRECCRLVDEVHRKLEKK